MHGTTINGKQSAHGTHLLRRLHTRIIVHGYAWSIYDLVNDPYRPIGTAWKIGKR